MKATLKYSMQLYFFSIMLGLTALFKGKFTKESVKRILCPMDPSRYYELPAIADYLIKYLKPSTRLLDISSPKLLTYFLSEKYPNANFVASDIQANELNLWKKSFGVFKNLSFKREDARRLSFSNSTFDLVYCVSTLEHVLDNESGQPGDTEVVKEVYRVLKKGGHFIYTTMISDKYNILYKKKDLYRTINKTNLKKAFFARVYDKKSLKSRIILSSKLRLVYTEICRYKAPYLESIYNSLVPFSSIFGLLNIGIFPFLLDVKRNKFSQFGKRSDILRILKKD